jgi:hypothetical protein
VGRVRLPNWKKVVEVEAADVEGLPRRTVYTPLNRTLAFDREVDYAPYIDDVTTNRVAKILRKQKEQIDKRWIMSKYETECNIIM